MLSIKPEDTETGETNNAIIIAIGNAYRRYKGFRIQSGVTFKRLHSVHIRSVSFPSSNLVWCYHINRLWQYVVDAPYLPGDASNFISLSPLTSEDQERLRDVLLLLPHLTHQLRYKRAQHRQACFPWGLFVRNMDPEHHVLVFVERFSTARLLWLIVIICVTSAVAAGLWARLVNGDLQTAISIATYGATFATLIAAVVAWMEVRSETPW